VLRVSIVVPVSLQVRVGRSRRWMRYTRAVVLNSAPNRCHRGTTACSAACRRSGSLPRRHSSGLLRRDPARTWRSRGATRRRARRGRGRASWGWGRRGPRDAAGSASAGPDCRNGMRRCRVLPSSTLPAAFFKASARSVHASRKAAALRAVAVESGHRPRIGGGACYRAAVSRAQHITHHPVHRLFHEISVQLGDCVGVAVAPERFCPFTGLA
jgi:hypothetical protein